MAELFKKCTTVGELKEAIKDLRDDMPVGKWDGCEALMYEWAIGTPSTVFRRNGELTVYGGFDDDDPDPTVEMLVL